MSEKALNLLLIDDDEVDRMAVRRALRSVDSVGSIREAASASEALELLREGGFDCALLDHHPPDHDGLAVLREVRAAGVTLPVIMMTGQGNEELAVEMMKAGANDYVAKSRFSLDYLAQAIRGAVRVHQAERLARAANERLLQETHVTETMHRIGTMLTQERDLRALVQTVTDESTRLTRAQFGAFFYNVVSPGAESYMLYTISGVPREEFSKFPMPRNTQLFAPTFSGAGVVRLDDVTRDPRYGKSSPHFGMPAGHLPVRSYLAVPVVSKSGEVIGGLFFGHEEPGRFGPREEQLAVGIGAQAAIAIDNVRLYEQLRAGEEQYRFLAESIPQVVWTADPAGKITYHNARWTDYTGLTLAQSRRSGWREVIHPDELPMTLEQYGRSLETGAPYSIEHRIRRRDGEYRWFLTRAVPLRDAEGQIAKWFGTTTDIHDRRLGEEALRISRERLDLVIGASELGVWYCDLPFSNLDWNAKCKEHFHLPPEAIVTIEVFYQRLHPDDREPTRQVIERCIEAHSFYDVDFRTLGANGEVKWVRALGRAFYDTAGLPRRFDGITIDVTDRKLAEDALRRAKDEAEQANAAKDQFLAVLSHELRTPLTPVLATVQALEVDAPAPAGLPAALDMIRRNVELEARLIDDLLDLTRISKGKLQLNVEITDVHEAVRAAVEICRSEVQSKRLMLHMDLGARRHVVRGDPARLQQVFWNLLKNAVKFTPAGGEVRVRSEADKDGRIMIAVSDTGIGIDPAALSRIFSAFEQAEQSITRRFGGLGLGLAISKALIDLHGGTLRAESEGPDCGAVFTITLPSAADVDVTAFAADSQRRRATTGDKGLAGGQPGSGVRILLVDDHSDTSSAMKRLLERQGYHVRTAASVGEALSAAREGFDLLISDIGLPDGSGLDLMRQLNGQRPIKGIALSGFGMDEDVRRSHEAGFFEHLTKPINFRRLEDAIRRLTQEKV